VDASRRHHRLGFWSAAFAFFVVMAFSTVPSPLYGLYQARDGFSSFLITIIYAAYAVGVISGLLFAGHLSDWYGRRRVLVPAIVVSIISAIVFLLWRDLPGLLIARVIDGLSVGVVTATATAYLGELHAVARPDAGPRGSQLIATAGNLGGLGFGPVLAGILAKWVKSPLTVPFIVFLGLLCAVLAAVTLAPETRPRRDPMPTYRIQRMSVPDEARGTFAAAAVGAFIAFGALGLFTALSATFLITLHHSSVALAGGTVGLMFAGGVIAQIAMSAWAPRRVLSLGMALMLAGLTLTVVATWLATPSLALFLAGGAVTGAGAGAVFKGAVGTVVAICCRCRYRPHSGFASGHTPRVRSPRCPRDHRRRSPAAQTRPHAVRERSHRRRGSFVRSQGGAVLLTHAHQPDRLRFDATSGLSPSVLHDGSSTF
jgi:predicted MFS family arabinose efflux permease